MIITRQLLESMFEMANSHEFLLVYSKGYGYEELLGRSNCCFYCFDKPQTARNRLFFEKYELPRIVKDYQPDVIFGPGNIGLKNPPCPQALFIHHAYLYHGADRSPQIELRDRLRIWDFRRQIKLCLSGSQQIFVQTPVVKERFCDFWNYPRENVRILRFPVPIDVASDLNHPVPQILESKKGYFKILFLTRYMAHRNPEMLLLLCKRYQQVFRKRKICFYITIGSHQRGKAKSFLRNVRKNDLEDIIINVGELTRQQVVTYYKHCDILWLHTLMETLCLPYLEAMTMGVPILAPDFDFSRYVCGDAALFYDPWQMDSLFRGIMELYENSQLRVQLIEKGRKEIQRTEKFSGNWQEAAREILDSLRQLACK